MDYFFSVTRRLCALFILVFSVSQSFAAGQYWDTTAVERWDATIIFGGTLARNFPGKGLDPAAGCQYVAGLAFPPTPWRFKGITELSDPPAMQFTCDIEVHPSDKASDPWVITSLEGYRNPVCPDGGYNYDSQTGSTDNQPLTGICKRPKQCNAQGPRSCTVTVSNGSPPVPSLTAISGCEFSVSVSDCRDVINRYGGSYVVTAYCTAYSTPTGRTADSGSALSCVSTGVPEQDPCQLPGATCGQDNNGGTCPPGFIKAEGGVCKSDTDHDGKPDDGSCPSGQTRPPPVGGVVQACSASGGGNDNGGGSGSGSGGSGGTQTGNGATKEDVKCGATGDLCEKTFQSYWDWVKEALGVAPSEIANGQALKASADSGAFADNAMTKGDVIPFNSSLNTSGFTGSACPAPRHIPLMGSSIEINFSYLCGIAAAVSFVVIGGASVAAARIVGGAING